MKQHLTKTPFRYLLPTPSISHFPSSFCPLSSLFLAYNILFLAVPVILYRCGIHKAR